MNPVGGVSICGSLIIGRIGDPKWLAELKCARPGRIALVVVFDFSDSCNHLHDLVSRLPRIVGQLPRDSTLWLYSLSNPDALDGGDSSVAHLLDGSLDLTKRLEDSQLRAKMALRGSLLRPVLESIERRRDSEHIDRTKVLVLTDGELLDAAPICVPNEIELVGLAVAPPDSGKRAHWSRVLRNVTLTDLSDPAVDRLFDSESNPFWGACEVSWEGSGSSLIAMDVDPKSFLGHQVDGSMKRWNSIDRPLLLLISTDSGNNPGPAVKCRSLRTGASIRVDLASANPVSDDVVRNVSSQFIEGTSEWGEVTLDVSASDPSFQQVEVQFHNARRLALARAPWIDEEGTRKVWKDMAVSDRASDEEGAAHFGALLCIAIQSLAAAKLIRILVFRLDMNRHPALTMGPDSSLHLHTKPFQINYDGLEARWILSHSGMSIELDPRSSQELQIPVAEGDDQMIITLFSGPMG